MTAIVGAEKRKFLLHKNLLADRCDFFSAAFGGQFAESEQKSIQLPDIDPAEFELFVDWLYRGTLEPIRPNGMDASVFGNTCKTEADEKIRFKIEEGLEREEWPYHRLYYMAERWCLDELKNLAMDQIRSFHYESEILLGFEFFQPAYENTREGSPMRKYITTYAMHLIFEEENSSDEIVKEFFSSLSFQTEDSARDLLRDVFIGLRQRFNSPEDPDDAAERCKYHDHADGKRCSGDLTSTHVK